MSKTYSAGIVTAYGAAKRAGYQGTYEDFCRQQAGYAESAAAVEQAKTTAVNAATTATTKAGEATTAATAAQTAKTQTEQAASQALTDIGTARTGAISAVQTEGATQTANARTQAQAAAASAATASTKASEASASATSAGQSATNAAESATSAAQSASDAQDVLDSIPADYSEMSSDVDQLKADLDNKSDTVDMLKAFPIDTASGVVASFTDGANGIPVKSLVVDIEPAQAGSGDPSPTNVRPISGWTGVEVTVSPTTDAEDGETYDITLPSEAGTVYGGSLDVTNGVLTVDMAIVDMGTLNWLYYSAKQRIVAQVNVGKPAGANVGLDGACSVYKVVNTGYQSAPDKSIVIGNNFISTSYAAMVVHDEDYTDAETFKTAVSGQMLVFPIKTPVTYQLTPTEVTTLLGTNNIWADTGDCTVEYRADTKLYIDRVYVDYRPMLAPVESTYTATRNYTTGQLLIVGNTLYKVTANIANGGNITPNTNVTATTLSEVISALA